MSDKSDTDYSVLVTCLSFTHKNLSVAYSVLDLGLKDRKDIDPVPKKVIVWWQWKTF